MSDAEFPDAVLRKMNHREWLAQFALSLQSTRERRGRPVTPFLLGAITRLQYAARYIRLIELELIEAEARISDLVESARAAYANDDDDGEHDGR